MRTNSLLNWQDRWTASGLHFPYSTRIKKDISDDDQLRGIRNLTNSRQHSQYRSKRLLLVRFPAGQSCHNQLPGKPTNCRYFCAQ